MRESGSEALVKLDDVGGIGADQRFGFIWTDAVSDQSHLVGLVDVPPLFGAGHRVDEQAAVELSDALKVLADPARLRLLSLVAASESGEACACDLVGPLERSQPTVSHHLSMLVDAGFLVREKRGRWAWYRVDETRLRDLCGLLCP